MEEITFTKMHGIGNDYIYIDCMQSVPANLAELARTMSHRHTGVGGDGIVLICPSDVADFRMRIFNADGSEAKMCGNASRCIAKYVTERGMTDKRSISLETLSGIKILHTHIDAAGKVDEVTVDMGTPSLLSTDIPVAAEGDTFIDIAVDEADGAAVTAVSMGNPHAVIFTDDLSTAHVHTLGSRLETSRLFPERANIEFARIESADRLTVRVWERGSGETQACGTGACAVAVAAEATGRAKMPLTIVLPGGELKIDRRDDGHIMMTGPATEVFSGTFKIQ